MKILYYSPHPNLRLDLPTGPGVHMREMIRAFEQEGHEVVRLIMGGETAANPHGRSSGDRQSFRSRVKHLVPGLLWHTFKDLNLLRFDRYAREQLNDLIARERPDMIYERAYYLMTSGVEAAKSHGIRHVLELNAPYPEERISMEGESLLASAGRRKEKRQITDTDRVAVVSSALRDYVLNIMPSAADKIVVTPNAIREDLVLPTPEVIKALRERLGLSGHRAVGFIGSIFPYHGVDQLITSFERLAAEFPKTKLVIVGDGAILGDLKKQAEGSGLAGRMVFTGAVPHEEALAYIGCFDLAVMPNSNWYGSPVKVFEYGAMGKPVVAPDLSPLRDAITDGENGFLFGDGDLEVALRRALTAPDKAEEAGNALRTKVFNVHTWRNNADVVAQPVN